MPNIREIGIPEERVRKTFEEIMAEIFQNLRKNTNPSMTLRENFIKAHYN